MVKYDDWFRNNKNELVITNHGLLNAILDIGSRLSKIEAEAAVLKSNQQGLDFRTIGGMPFGGGAVGSVSGPEVTKPKAEPAPQREPGWYWVWWADFEERQPAELQRIVDGLTWWRPGLGSVNYTPWRIGSRIPEPSE